ncbi:uncharacterized protein LOC131214650, partial [Anopheles bellator]|uniref:uncharacterized protein LOC131214648 n=1 Tax=Anopheles bellator TaxID=139047 RepID=UPI0026497637
YLNSFRNIYSVIAQQLPPNVNLLTLEPWKDGKLLVRFEHIFETGEDSVYSQAVRFNIRDVFYALNIESIRETTLGANQWKEDSRRLQFNVESNDIKREEQSDEVEFRQNNDDFSIELQPMEI